MKLTDWFPSSVSPTLVGVYEVAPDDSGPWYAYWNGDAFGFIEQSVEKAAKYQNGWHRKLTWRGLAENPGKA